MLLDMFGEPGWERFDEAVDRGELGLREAGDHQVAMLRGSREEMLAFALPRAQLAPSFPTFVGMGRGARPAAGARVRRVRVLHPPDPGGGQPRAPGGGHQRTRLRGPGSLPTPPERSPRVHRLRDVQDARRAAAAGAPRPGRVRRRWSVRPLRCAVLGHRLREGCTRARSASSTVCRSAVGRRSTTSGERSKPCRGGARARRRRTLSRVADLVKVPLPEGLTPPLGDRGGRGRHLRADRGVRARGRRRRRGRPTRHHRRLRTPRVRTRARHAPGVRGRGPGGLGRALPARAPRPTCAPRTEAEASARRSSRGSKRAPWRSASPVSARRRPTRTPARVSSSSRAATSRRGRRGSSGSSSTGRRNRPRCPRASRSGPTSPPTRGSCTR